MIILTAILILLLLGNWFINETLIFIPVHLVTRLTSWGWWALALLGCLFIAWCVGEDR